MTEEKIINISEYWNGEGTPEVVIKRLSWGAQNKILDAVSNVSVKGKTVEVSPQYGRLRDLTLLKCIVKAPFPITPEYLENEMTTILGDFLFEQIDNFNNSGRIDKKN